MAEPARRRFTLFDALVLVAATAFGMNSMREMGSLGLTNLGSRYDGSPLGWVAMRLPFACQLLSPCVGVWTVALLGLRFRAPRPQREQLAKLPGAAACVAAVVALLIPAIETVADAVVARVGSASPMRMAMLHTIWEAVEQRWIHSVYPPPGIAVAAVWLVLVLAGQWRPEPTWIDRAGRLAGVYWLFMICCRVATEAMFALGVLHSTVRVNF